MIMKMNIHRSQVLMLSLSCAVMALLSCTHRMPAFLGQYSPPQTAKCSLSLGTVCLVELHNNTAHPQISADVTETLYQTLQKKNLSGLSLLRQNDMNWKNLQIKPDSNYTLEQLLATRKMLQVDTILTGSVTSYTPYPHMAMGLHLKLIDLRNGQVIWAIEQVWDTADKVTEQRIKKYFERQLRSDFSPLDEQLATISSINFVRFVTYDATETLKQAES
jgi:hypothetical protein